MSGACTLEHILKFLVNIFETVNDSNTIMCTAYLSSVDSHYEVLFPKTLGAFANDQTVAVEIMISYFCFLCNANKEGSREVKRSDQSATAGLFPSRLCI